MRWIQARGRGDFDGDGKLIWMIGSNRDITETKNAETAFLETARVFRALTQASPRLVFRANNKGQLTFVNAERWAEFSGLEPNQWEGEGWFSAFHPSDVDRAQQTWQSVIDGAGSFREEYRWRHIDGEARWILFQADPLEDIHGATSYVGTGTDVSALKSAKREQATLQTALAESQKMEAIGTLASGVAHDFNNFLAAVRGYVELVHINLDSPGQANKYLVQAELAIDEAKEVTNGLLTFSRGGGPERGFLCLNTIITENVDLLRQLVPASISIKCHVPDKEVWILGDASQLRQVLVNLVINSRDALDDERGEIGVTLGFEGDSWVSLVVQDNGRGMSTETQERAFEPFYTTKEHGRGAGLGLSVVHGIVSSHDSELVIVSDQSKGTQIDVRFPLTEIRTALVESLPTPESILGQQRVLLVEDNPLVRESCALRMEASGYRVVSAEHGEAALDQLSLAREPFDVMLLDVDLPGANGVEIAGQVRSQMPTMKVVYIIGNLKNRALKRALDSDPVIAKPIDYVALFQTINEIMAN